MLLIARVKIADRKVLIIVITDFLLCRSLHQMEEDGNKSKIYRLVVLTFVFQSYGEMIRLCLLVLQIPIT